MFSECRPTQTYHVLVRSEKVKQVWVEKIGKIITLNAENVKKVSEMIVACYACLYEYECECVSEWVVSE